MIFVIILILASVILLAWAWASAIDDMNNNHPDYKGEDFLHLPGKKAPWETEDEDENKVWEVTLMDGLEEEEWDNKHHNEDCK